MRRKEKIRRNRKGVIEVWKKTSFVPATQTRKVGACMAEIMVTIPLRMYDQLRDDSLLLQKIITYQKNEEYSDRTINAILGIVKKDEEET